MEIKMSRSKILLVDDHPVVLEGLTQFINNEPDLTVCAIASDASQAMELIASHAPDLVVADLSLSGRLGLELIKDLAVQYPSIPILVLSIHDESVWAERVLRAGAEGYIMKSQATGRITEAIRRILGGGIWVSAEVNEALLQKQLRNHKPLQGSPLDQLSDRELEVFHCIGRGMNMKEIAAAFHLSSKTVEVHRDHVREKLRLRSSAELIRYAVSYMLADA
jgi:DNA-binding NarL/FixJ family response regulator